MCVTCPDLITPPSSSAVGESSQLKTNLRLAMEKIRMAVLSKTSQNTVG